MKVGGADSDDGSGDVVELQAGYLLGCGILQCTCGLAPT
jgi:hypothetical protein